MDGFHEEDPINPLTGKIIGAAITIHRHLGPGLLESSYKACFAAELRHLGLRFAQEVPVPLLYRDVRLDVGYRMDLLVEESVVVELKVAKKLDAVHTSQVLSYLRLAELRVGLLFNFNVDALVVGGIRRIFHGR